MSLIRAAATLAVIAGGAGRHHVVPNVLAALEAGDDVVDCETDFPAATILASITVTTEDLPPGELDVWTGTPHLKLKPDDGWARNLNRNGSQVAAAVGHHCGFPPKDQYHCPPRRANVDWLEVGVQYKDGFVHRALGILAIIA